MSEDKKQNPPTKPLENPPIQNETKATREPVFIGDGANTTDKKK